MKNLLWMSIPLQYMHGSGIPLRDFRKRIETAPELCYNCLQSDKERMYILCPVHRLYLQHKLKNT
ncbi:MAG: hypothetical protein J6D10_13495, partial [Clostridia bacterium]|nr:hypothetical protein [Clostridia bacterium]